MILPSELSTSQNPYPLQVEIVNKLLLSNSETNNAAETVNQRVKYLLENEFIFRNIEAEAEKIEDYDKLSDFLRINARNIDLVVQSVCWDYADYNSIGDQTLLGLFRPPKERLAEATSRLPFNERVESLNIAIKTFGFPFSLRTFRNGVYFHAATVIGIDDNKNPIVHRKSKDAMSVITADEKWLSNNSVFKTYYEAIET